MLRIIGSTLAVAAVTALAGCGEAGSNAGRTSSEGGAPTLAPSGGTSAGTPGPPNQTESVDARWEYGPVCQHGEIRLTPLGTTPPA
ncbi:hypothetical protein BKA00_006994 [Actinomadura coerulea]|uniref:Alpha/beta hydrolase n=1 Tax=Actinomadura coerulea TaxID=46159 RepID=A0A7X0L2Z1_9ACTN|nr:hypothetical protein [Actinomadura coerulea]MBB6400080.1 hypothetical protein [Actinomadura coerulea]GGQ21892.1 hypothetical protein GCM10010187_42790 [Actinomadura coerulea]